MNDERYELYPYNADVSEPTAAEPRRTVPDSFAEPPSNLEVAEAPVPEPVPPGPTGRWQAAIGITVGIVAVAVAIGGNVVNRGHHTDRSESCNILTVYANLTLVGGDCPGQTYGGYVVVGPVEPPASGSCTDLSPADFASSEVVASEDVYPTEDGVDIGMRMPDSIPFPGCYLWRPGKA